MRITLDLIAEHLRACANCGRGTYLRTSPIDLYCANCWSNLFKCSSFSESDDYPFKVFSLFTWTPFTPEIQNLIYSLKGGGLPSAFLKLAERFAFEICVQKPSRDSILVVPPSSRPSENDHALAWASALSEVLGLEILSPFEFATEGKANDPPQKRLEVAARFCRQFKLKDVSFPKDRPVVFVDDLITSGATALAAHKALNSPVDFTAWTIARRPKLAAN